MSRDDAASENLPDLTAASLGIWLGHLRQRLARRYWSVDPHLLDASIEDALLRHMRKPQQFDPARSALSEYLAMWARSYLFRRLRRERCHKGHEKVVGASEKQFEQILSEIRAGRSMYSERGSETREAEREALEKAAASLSLLEQAEVELLCQGASPADWVRLLGIAHLPKAEQHHKVNAEKDRLKKKLRRKLKRK